MTTEAHPDRRRHLADAERAQPPIRWPRPNRTTIGLVLLWAVGGFIALFLPAFIVSPTATTAPAGHVWTAFALTIVGSLVMIGASSLLWRRSKDLSFFVLGGVPAFACIAGGVILAAGKLTGT